MSNQQIEWDPQIKQRLDNFISKMPLFHRRIAEKLIAEEAQAFPDIAAKGAGIAQNLTQRAAENITQSAPVVKQVIIQQTPNILANAWLWFLIGAIFATIIYFIFSYRKK